MSATAGCCTAVLKRSSLLLQEAAAEVADRSHTISHTSRLDLQACRRTAVQPAPATQPRHSHHLAAAPHLTNLNTFSPPAQFYENCHHKGNKILEQKLTNPGTK